MFHCKCSNVGQVPRFTQGWVRPQQSNTGQTQTPLPPPEVCSVATAAFPFIPPTLCLTPSPSFAYTVKAPWPHDYTHVFFFFFSHPLPVQKQLQNHRFLVLSSSPEISYSFSSPSDIHYFPESKSPYVERKWGVSGNSGGGRQAEGRGLGEWNGIEWCCVLHKGLLASQSVSRKSWYDLLELPCQSCNHGFGQTISQHKHREKRLFPTFL